MSKLLVSSVLAAVLLAGCAGNTYNIALYNKDTNTRAAADVPTTIGGNKASAHNAPLRQSKPKVTSHYTGGSEPRQLPARPQQ